MKKKILSLGLALGLTFSVGLGIVSCNEKEPTPDTPSSVVKTTLLLDTKRVITDYVEGDKFDPTNLVVKKVVETDGVKADPITLKEDEYTLSIEAGQVLKLTDKSVTVTPKDTAIKPVSFQIKVTEALPTVLDRLIELKATTNYLVGVDGELDTKNGGVDQNTILEKTIEYTPLAWTSSTILQKNYNRPIEETGILLNVDKGVAALEPTPQGTFVGGIVPSTVASNYEEIVPISSKNLIVREDKPTFVEALDVPEYTFDLTLTAADKPKNIDDTLNAMFLAEIMGIGAYNQLIDDVTLKTTKKGLDISIIIENTDAETYVQYPVSGYFHAQVLIDKATDYAPLVNEINDDAKFPVLKVSEDVQELVDMANNETYQIKLDLPATPSAPATTTQIFYGKDYFSIIDTNTITGDIINRQLLLASERGFEIWLDVPVDPKLPEGETKIGVGASIPAKEIEELGSTPIEFLHEFVSTQVGLPFLQDAPELSELGRLFAGPYDEIFQPDPEGKNTLPHGFLFKDFVNVLGFVRNADAHTMPVPSTYQDPLGIAFTAVLWDKGEDLKGHSDDTVYLATVYATGSGSIQFPFSDFGTESPMKALVDAEIAKESK